MVRTHVMHQGFIKRSGVTAASFLIATLALVIVNASNASALLGVELPLGKNLAPVTDRVNGLVNKGLGLPVTIDSTDKLKVSLLDVADVEANIPVVPAVVDGVTQPLNGTVKGLSDTLRPVTDNTIPAVRGALSRSLNRDGSSPQPPTTAPPTDGTSAPNGSDVAGVSDTAPVATGSESDIEQVPQQTTFFGGVASFFASTMPAALQDIARNIAGKEVGFGPIIISMLLFLMTLGAIGGIVFASNHGGVVALGRYKFALLANGNDRTEMATFIVVAISFGIVAIFLALTNL